MTTKIIETGTPASALASLLSETPSGSVFILTDSTVEKLYLDQIAAATPQAQSFVLPAGEEHKNLESQTKVWEFLCTHGGTRSSILINLGGGTITDLGGFAAATFKRGIRTINIPTTLLASADASLGGKTGINFCGLKNEIGAFHNPMAVILSSSFFSTLPPSEILSGWAEVVKMALITPDIPYTPQQIFDIDPLSLNSDVSKLLKIAVESKRDITTRDPQEHGIRAHLNLGHTAAHAFESLAMQRHTPIPHGIAVAHGILLALTLSGSDLVHSYSGFLKRTYPPLPFTKADAHHLAELMLHDKKNQTAGTIRFITLPAVGYPAIIPFTLPQIEATLLHLLN